MTDNEYKKIAIILDEVVMYLDTPESDVLWSSFERPEDVIKLLKGLKTRVLKKDKTAIEELNILFTATGDLQEISLSSGWSDQYLSLAERFDSSSKKIFAYNFILILMAVIILLVIFYMFVF